jgi:hypothetical protein
MTISGPIDQLKVTDVHFQLIWPKGSERWPSLYQMTYGKQPMSIFVSDDLRNATDDNFQSSWPTGSNQWPFPFKMTWGRQLMTISNKFKSLQRLRVSTRYRGYPRGIAIDCLRWSIGLEMVITYILWSIGKCGRILRGRIVRGRIVVDPLQIPLNGSTGITDDYE